MAPPAEPPKAITLKVKVPPGHLADGLDEFSLGDQVPVSQTIGQIRQRLSQSLPATPAPERLRVLFGGRALVDDDQPLGDALNVRRDPGQKIYYVHLLVKGEGAANAPVPRASSHRRGMSTPMRSASPAQQTPSDGAPAGRQQPVELPDVQQLQAIESRILAQEQQHQQLHALRQHRAQQQHIDSAPGPVHFPALPPQLFPGMLPHPQLPAQNAHQPITPAQTDGTAEGDPNSLPSNWTPDTIPPRSASQPPPHHLNRGMHIEGVGPNGELVVIHQQTVNLNPLQFGQLGPSGLRQVATGFSPFPAMPHQHQVRRNGPSALDQARDNITEMRRILEEIRGQADTDEARSRIAQLEQRTQSLNDYLDPMSLGFTNHGPLNHTHAQDIVNNPGPATSIPAPQQPSTHGRAATPLPFLAHRQQQAQNIRQAQQRQTQASRPNEVTAYLLSSPTGPQAILFSPQHGTFTGSALRATQQVRLTVQPSPTTQVSGSAIAENVAAQPNQPAAQGQAAPVQAVPAQAAPAQPDPLGPMAPFINHVWLLLRILIFAYFLLGANLGWRRPLALIAIGLGFWLMRQGLLGDGAVVRRWWDGIVHDGGPAQAQGQPQQQHEGAQQPAQGQLQQQHEGAHQPAQPQGPAAVGDPRPGPMPTPEQVAQRLFDEAQRRRHERWQRLREHFRPVERTIALLVASLFPGVGEAYVRGREEAERRRAEAEIAARRREAEELQRREAEEKKKAEGEQKVEGALEKLQPSASSEVATTSTSA